MDNDSGLHLSGAYQAWLAALFAHSEGSDVCPENFSPPDPIQACIWVAELFEHSGTLLSGIKDDVVAAAIEYLIDPGQSDYGPLCVMAGVPLETRRRYFDSMYALFHDVFSVRLDNVQFKVPGKQALEAACLKFWTLVPLNTYTVPPGGDPNEATLDGRNIAAVTAVWKRVLSMNCEACVRSVLLAAAEAYEMPSWSRCLHSMADDLYRTGIPLGRLVFEDPESVMWRVE